MSSKTQWINPLVIRDFCIVFSDDKQGFLGWIIKSHTKGIYNHVMVLTRHNILLTQNFSGLKEVSVASYMKRRYTLKFFKIKNMTPERAALLTKMVTDDLKAPWHRKRYDWAGVIGQWLGIRWLNNPWTKYCSERVASYLRALGIAIKLHPSPSDLNKICESQCELEYIGHWFEG